MFETNDKKDDSVFYFSIRQNLIELCDALRVSWKSFFLLVFNEFNRVQFDISRNDLTISLISRLNDIIDLIGSWFKRNSLRWLRISSIISTLSVIKNTFFSLSWNRFQEFIGIQSKKWIFYFKWWTLHTKS